MSDTTPTTNLTETTTTPTGASSSPTETPTSPTAGSSTTTPTEPGTSNTSTTSPTTPSPPPPSTTTSSLPTSTSTSTPIVPSSSSTPSTTTTSSRVTTPSSSVIITTQTTDSAGSTRIVTITSTAVASDTPTLSQSTTASTTTDGLVTTTTPAAGGLSQQGTIAVAVVVPVVGVALLVVAALFLWRRRKQRMDAEEERRKEVEDYSYNPNNDPMLPDVGSAAGAYEMKDDGGSGYRGWGSTTVGSTGRKASTTMSGGVAGVAYSDATSPTRGGVSDTRSEGPLVDGSRSPEGEILGAMGPSAADNRGNVHRGPSNASSSYSAAGRSDASGENSVGVAYGGGYYDSYGNPYSTSAPGQQGPGELSAQPVIRDNPARRNTRIENPSHFPQQSAGISQNF